MNIYTIKKILFLPLIVFILSGCFDQRKEKEIKKTQEEIVLEGISANLLAMWRNISIKEKVACTSYKILSEIKTSKDAEIFLSKMREGDKNECIFYKLAKKKVDAVFNNIIKNEKLTGKYYVFYLDKSLIGLFDNKSICRAINNKARDIGHSTTKCNEWPDPKWKRIRKLQN